MGPVLILSSHPLVDRVLRHTAVLPVLSERTETVVWTMSQTDTGKWHGCAVEPFPEIGHLPEVPHNWTRRINEYAWDDRIQDPSRLSMLRHARQRGLSQKRTWFRAVGVAASRLGLTERLESAAERMLLGFNRSPEAQERLLQLRPSMVVCTGTFRFEEPAVAAAARQLGIPVYGFITSWDNVSTKNRMVLRYDGFLVWSESMKQDLLRCYPNAATVPIHVVGAPQFDVFTNPEFLQSRQEFCSRHGLRPDLPYVLYTLGVANGVVEYHEALAAARRIERGDLGEVQMLVRPHPFQNREDLQTYFRGLSPRIVLQDTANPETPRHLRQQDKASITDWVNTFRHSAVVVHLSSTTAIDAALFDRPVVGLDYDPEPGAPNQTLVREVNHLWTHYKPVAESGGMWLVNNTQELMEAIGAYLHNPALHREARRRMAEYVCGFSDGRCGERMANAILSLAGGERESSGTRCDASSVGA